MRQMKAALFNLIRHPGRKLAFVLSTIGLLFGGSSSLATEALSSWNVDVTTPQVIDATSFYNSGSWNITVAPYPFMTANTLNYTNAGTMNSSIGWEFDFGPNNSDSPSTRTWSSTFFNDTHGTVSATGSTVNQLTTTATQVPVDYLLVSATNIYNKGLLSADGYGEINLTGSTVDLHRSTVEIIPIVPVSGGSVNTSTNFTSDTGVFDEYWAQGNAGNVNSSTIWSGTQAQSPKANVTECSSSTTATLGFPPTFSDSTNIDAGSISLTLTNSDGSTTNVILATNVVRQAVFVYTVDPAFTGQIHFSPSMDESNKFMTVAVKLSMPSTNFDTLALQTNSLYLVDTLASSTNGGLVPNTTVQPYSDCPSTTERPANYVLSRSDPGDFINGLAGDGPPANNFLYQNNFTNRNVNVKYAAYGVLVDSRSLQLSSSFPVSSEPGRIQITASNLNLNQTRMRAESTIMIQASNLVGSAGAVMDSPNISFDLSSPSGNLNVTNLVLQSVTRLQGTIDCWSGVWSNSMTVVSPNYSIDTNTSIATYSPLTNTVYVGLYALLVNASGLSSQTPVSVQDLVLHSTNMVVSDTINNLAGTVLFDGQSLTLNGGMSLLDSITNWSYALAPTLRYFTNNSTLDIGYDAHFGDDGPTNYLVFVNTGWIYSYDQTINADNLQIINGENETLYGNFNGITQTGQLSGAEIISEGNLQFTANTLRINNSILESYNALNFNVTGFLSDNGAGSGNIFLCENGFNLPIKPSTGDLLGTTIYSVANDYDEVDHTWAGTNLGATVAGYVNNEAIGTLILLPQGNTNVFKPLFAFYGTDGITDGNAMYVSNLDLSHLTDVANEIYIDPTMDIYFASASLDGTNGAEAFLDGQFGGHLHWIQSTDIPPKPQISNTAVNSGGAFYLTVSSPTNLSVIVQSSTNLANPNWMNVFTSVPPFTFTDSASTNYPERFYRTLLGP